MAPLAVTHADMGHALDRGFAVPFGPGVLSGIARWAGAWWVAWEGGWLRVTDELTAADLDAAAARLAEAEAASGAERPAEARDEPGGAQDMGR
jgi:hypothetical protein